MRFDIITIFPNLFNDFKKEALIARAQKKGLIKIETHNLRDWTTDKHKTVDDRPFGGGVGMVLKIAPIFSAVKSLKLKVKSKKTRIILFSAKGKRFTQKDAKRLSKYDNIIMICGRYEGVDERVAKYVADEEISIGDYVLFGGEVPAMVAIEAISRLIPGVVAKEESVKNESFSDGSNLEHPQYTRPEEFKVESLKSPSFAKATAGKKAKTKNWKVPKVLLSGDHKAINEWRRKNSK